MTNTATQTNTDAERVSHIVARLRAAIDLAERMGIVGSHPTNIHRIAIEAADIIEAQSKALAEAREALKPFAEAADLIPDSEADFKVVAMVPAGPHAAAFRKMGDRITAGELRRARAILTPTPENPNG